MQNPIIGITPDYSYEKSRFKISQNYSDAILQAGGIPVLLFPDTPFPNFVDGILFTGGGDIDPLLFGEEPILQNGEISPLRDAYELQLCKEAFARNMPLLGVCRGMQIMNIAAGGGIYQDIGVQTNSTLKHNQQAPRSYATHSICITKGSLLESLWQVQSITVNSVHHQAVSHLGEGFVVSASSMDGLTEAIEKPECDFVVGVQWHPEAMQTKEQIALFHQFVDAARRYHCEERKEKEVCKKQ